MGYGRVHRADRGADEQRSLGQKIAWDPHRAHIAPCGPRFPPPLRVMLEGREDIDTLLVHEIIVRDEDVAVLQNLEFHLDADRSPDVHRARHGATLVAYTDGVQPHDVVAGGPSRI